MPIDYVHFQKLKVGDNYFVGGECFRVVKIDYVQQTVCGDSILSSKPYVYHSFGNVTRFTTNTGLTVWSNPNNKSAGNCQQQQQPPPLPLMPPKPPPIIERKIKIVAKK